MNEIPQSWGAAVRNDRTEERPFSTDKVRMKTLSFFLLFLSMNAFAGRQEILSLLPVKLQKLSISKTSLKEAQKLLGKPDYVEGEKQYWVEKGFKYAIELTFKDSKLVSLHYSFPVKPDAKVIQKEFKEDDFKPFTHDVNLLKATSEHEEVVINVASKKLESVRIK